MITIENNIRKHTCDKCNRLLIHDVDTTECVSEYFNNTGPIILCTECHTNIFKWAGKYLYRESK